MLLYATSVHQTFTKKMICVVPENFGCSNTLQAYRNVQYAHFSSSHLLSVKRGFIKRETLRLLRTNLANETFELRKLEFLTRLLERC